jgi:hypothetical protein
LEARDGGAGEGEAAGLVAADELRGWVAGELVREWIEWWHDPWLVRDEHSSRDYPQIALSAG